MPARGRARRRPGRLDRVHHPDARRGAGRARRGRSAPSSTWSGGWPTAHPDKHDRVPGEDGLLLLDDEPHRPAAPGALAGVAGRRARSSTASPSSRRWPPTPGWRSTGCSPCRSRPGALSRRADYGEAVKLRREARRRVADAETGGDVADDDDRRPAARTVPPRSGATPQGRRGPVTAPKTRKEAYARQKQQASEQRAARPPAAAAVKPRSAAEQRAALQAAATRVGAAPPRPGPDPQAGPRLRRLEADASATTCCGCSRSDHRARSCRRCRSSSSSSSLLFLGLIVEWYFAGRRIRALAIERFGKADGGNMSARLLLPAAAPTCRAGGACPHPQVERGDRSEVRPVTTVDGSPRTAGAIEEARVDHQHDAGRLPADDHGDPAARRRGCTPTASA